MSGEVANACVGDFTHDASDSGGAVFLKDELPVIKTWLQPGEHVVFLSSKPLKRFLVEMGGNDHLAEARCS